MIETLGLFAIYLFILGIIGYLIEKFDLGERPMKLESLVNKLQEGTIVRIVNPKTGLDTKIVSRDQLEFYGNESKVMRIEVNSNELTVIIKQKHRS